MISSTILRPRDRRLIRMNKKLWKDHYEHSNLVRTTKSPFDSIIEASRL